MDMIGFSFERNQTGNNVGIIGKSEKSNENSPGKVFQNALIDYTNWVGWILGFQDSLNAVGLARSQRCATLKVWGFF